MNQLIIFLLMIGTIIPIESVSVVGNVKQDFDYLIFRQIWPPASCMFPGNNTCSIDKNISTWVVHGLW